MAAIPPMQVQVQYRRLPSIGVALLIGALSVFWFFAGVGVGALVNR